MVDILTLVHGHHGRLVVAIHGHPCLAGEAIPDQYQEHSNKQQFHCSLYLYLPDTVTD